MHGAVKRIRPKMMTVTAMFMGLLPIMWSLGAGADMMKRVAAPMVGGVFTSFILELLVYPVLYSIWKWRFVMKKGSVIPPTGGDRRPRSRILTRIAPHDRQYVHHDQGEFVVVRLAFAVDEDEGGTGGRGHGGIFAADGLPDDLIQKQIIGGIFLGEIHRARSLFAPGSFDIHFVQIDAGGERGVGARSGSLWKAANMGVAAASYCDMGLRPRISSIVRNMLLVEYMVESTVWRLMYGLTTKPACDARRRGRPRSARHPRG